MFEVFCPAHRAHVLLSTSRIVVLSTTTEGVVVDWRCWCGHRGRSLEGRELGPDGDGTGQQPPRLTAAS